MLVILAWAIIVTAIVGALSFAAASRRDSGDAGYFAVLLTGISVPVLVIEGILLAFGVLLSTG